MLTLSKRKLAINKIVRLHFKDHTKFRYPMNFVVGMFNSVKPIGFKSNRSNN